MKKISIFLGIVLIGSAIYAKNAKVTLVSKSYKEVVITDNHGKKVTKLIDTKKVLPGDIIVYQNTVNNAQNKPVKHMVLNNPIPNHMRYIANSAKCETPCTILYSVDHGKKFDTPENLQIKTQDGYRIASANDYTNIKWIMKNPLPGHHQITVSYKAKLK